MSEPIPIENFAQIHTYEGQQVIFTGRVSNEPWQHMIGSFDTHPCSAYINDKDDDQIVGYFKREVRCPGKLKIIGTVIKLEGRSKRPGSDQKVVEYQILADEFQCL